MQPLPDPDPSVLLDVHGNERAVTVKKPFATSISPQVLSAYYGTDEAGSSAVEHRQAEATWVHGIHYMLMPVHRSPLLCVIQHSPQQPWKYRYVNSLQTISILRCIMEAYGRTGKTTYYLAYAERIDKARDHFGQQFELHTNWLHDTLRPIYEAWKLRQLCEKDALERFVRVMERCTLNVIHLMEQCVHSMFAFDRQFPLAQCLTPNVTPNLDQLHAKELEMVDRVVVHFYALKESAMNALLKDATPDGVDYEPRKWFNLGDMKTRRQRTPPDETYKGYLPRDTAFELFQFMDISAN